MHVSISSRADENNSMLNMQRHTRGDIPQTTTVADRTAAERTQQRAQRDARPAGRRRFLWALVLVSSIRCGVRLACLSLLPRHCFPIIIFIKLFHGLPHREGDACCARLLLAPRLAFPFAVVVQHHQTISPICIQYLNRPHQQCVSCADGCESK